MRLLPVAQLLQLALASPGHWAATCDGGRCQAEPSYSREKIYYHREQPEVLAVKRDNLIFDEAEYALGIVADLDLGSRDPDLFLWRSYLKTGRIVRTSSKDARPAFTLRWDEELELKSTTARNNRSMELSELVIYQRLMLAFCDYTGIAFKISLRPGEQGRRAEVFQRWAIADGDGNEAKPFKAEWATLKDGKLFLGSIGFEWYGSNGEILHRNAEWVKIIDPNGNVQNIDWHPIYQTIRTKTNTHSPGFLWHEAVEWDPYARKWIFLPRFGSTMQKYTPGLETESTLSLLVVCDEYFSDIQVVYLPHHEPGYGFTSVRKLPGSNRDPIDGGALFVALRVKEELDGSQFTQIGVFDLKGRFYTDRGEDAWAPWLDVGPRKFEGLSFL